MRRNDTSQTVVELPALVLPLERWQRGELRELLAERVYAGVVESQPVERALVELGDRDIGRVRVRDRVVALGDQTGGELEGVRDALVAQRSD